MLTPYCRGCSPSKFHGKLSPFPPLIYSAALLQMDVDEAVEVAEQFDVQVVPTFIFMKVSGVCLGEPRGVQERSFALPLAFISPSVSLSPCTPSVFPFCSARPSLASWRVQTLQSCPAG